MADKNSSGRSIGRHSAKLTKRRRKAGGKGEKEEEKAFMFVRKGTHVVGNNLDLEVVALDPVTFEVMIPRRC
jgi:hypothetical protein